MTATSSTTTRGNALLTSRFRYADRRLFFGCARLYEDHVELTGWHWKGRHRRTVRLDEFDRISWRTDTERSANVTLYLHDGEPVRLWLDAAGLWKYQVEARLGKRLSMRAALPAPADEILVRGNGLLDAS